MAGAFKPRNILFVLLATVVFLIIGMAFAGVTGAGKSQGLAGGAIVFGYGVAAGLIALGASVVSVRFLAERVVVTINKILALLLVLAVAVIVYRVQTMGTDVASDPTPDPLPVTQPLTPDPAGITSGVGMVALRFFDHPVIYFY